MTIFHVMPQFPIVNDRVVIGGYPSSVFALARAQHAAGLDVCIVSRIPEHHDYEGPVALRSIGTLDAKSHKRPQDFLRSVVRFARSHTAEGDVLHFHSGYAEYMLCSSSVTAAARRTRVFHTLYCPLAPGLRGKSQSFLIRIAKSFGVAVSGTSQNVANQMGKGASWTPPVIDVEYFAPSSQPTAGDTLLFVGNATPEKGLADLLGAFQTLRGRDSRTSKIALTVTTELDRTNASVEIDKAMREIADGGDLAALTQLSVVSDMRSLLASHRVHVAPFRGTQGPSDYFMSTLEAMSSGLTCVVSDLPGMSEVVQDNVNGFVFPAGDKDQLAETIERAVAADHIAIGSAARKTVEEMFAIKAVATTQGLYED